MFSNLRSLWGKSRQEEEAAEAARAAALESQAMAVAAANKKGTVASLEMLGRTIVATIIDSDLTAPKVADLQVELVIKLSSRPDARNVVLDLQNVEYLDSACLGMMLQLLRRVKENGGKIAIASVRTRVEGLFKLTRLERLFPIKRSVLDAVECVERSG